jgi:prepilin-type N-terminal cleavage/methylation domain-containing protein
MLKRRHPTTGFTLIELLLVVALMSLVAGMLIPNTQVSARDQLESTAELLAGDLALARSLAVAGDSQYSITFDLSQNRYTLEHVGTNTALDTLPSSPFAVAGDPATQYIVRIDNLPRMGGNVRLQLVRAAGTPATTVNDVIFSSLGETTRPEATEIWLAANSGRAARYLSITVNPVTGLASLGQLQAADPQAIAVSSKNFSSE